MKKLQKNNPNTTHKWLIGIDEVGRGPLAGPVAVCAAMVRADFDLSWIKKHKPKLTDSKGLSEAAREQWNKTLQVLIKKGNLHFALSYASAKEIDKKGIAVCIRSLINKNLKKLKVKQKNLSNKNSLILLDGGLKAPEEYIFQKTIIKGDVKKPIISFASIIAKVARDSLMKKLSKIHKDYGFEKHKGYGTLAHRIAIKMNGPSVVHRKSFISRIV